VFYRTGGVYTFTASQTTYFAEVANVIQYDNAGSLANVPTNAYVAYWAFGTNDLANPIWFIPGQRTDGTLSNARANNTYEGLSLGALPSPEMKLLYRVLIRRNGTNETFTELQDYRGSSTLPSSSYTPTDHGTLSGLSDDDHPQYVDRGAERQMFTATSGQTVFDITAFSYTTGQNELLVFVAGVLQGVTTEYAETDTDTITFGTGIPVGTIVRIYRL
jgi:hypothetical protein